MSCHCFVKFGQQKKAKVGKVGVLRVFGSLGVKWRRNRVLSLWQLKALFYQKSTGLGFNPVAVLCNTDQGLIVQLFQLKLEVFFMMVLQNEKDLLHLTTWFQLEKLPSNVWQVVDKVHSTCHLGDITFRWFHDGVQHFCNSVIDILSLFTLTQT